MSKILVLPVCERSVLEDILCNHTKPYLRNRAQCVLLRADGFKVSELAKIYKTRSHTIYKWLNLYEKEGFIGLKIKKGRGAKSQMQDLDSSQIEIIKEEITHNPQNLKQVSSILTDIFGFRITKLMLKSYLKKTQVHMA